MSRPVQPKLITIPSGCDLDIIRDPKGPRNRQFRIPRSVLERVLCHSSEVLGSCVDRVVEKLAPEVEETDVGKRGGGFLLFVSFVVHNKHAVKVALVASLSV